MFPNPTANTADRQAGVSSCPGSGTSQRGFTLLEVMIVIVIVGVMAAIGIPSFSSWRENQAVRNAAQALLVQLKQARTLAMTENRTVSITFGVDANGSEQYTYDAGSSGPEKNVVVSYQKKFSGNLHITKNDPTQQPNTLNFKSHGTVGNATIYFCSAGHSKRIGLNRIGRAYLCGPGDTSISCTQAYTCQ